MDHEDEDRLPLISQVIAAAKAKDIKVILITEDVSPAALHNLLREGGDEFVPYPLPENELARAIERVLTPQETMAVAPEGGDVPRDRGRTADRHRIDGQRIFAASDEFL